MKAKQRRVGGRPPAGIAGEQVQGYRRATIYLPPETQAAIAALRVLRGAPAWRIVHEAIQALVRDLPPEDRRAVEALIRRAVAAPERGAA